MKTRLLATALISALMTACGGGGGSAPSLPSRTSSVPQSVSFTFKVPAKAKQVRRMMMIHGQYVSPATLGLGLNFSTTATTFTSAQLAAPNYAVSLASCQPTQYSTCTANADGSYTYTLTVPLPPASYTCELVTWDAPPTSTPSFSGNQLSSSIFNVTVTAGGAPQTPAFVLNGVPHSLVLTPAPNQAHLVTSASSSTIVGNAQVVFFLNALDADGYVITGSGAPTLSMTDSTNSFSLTQSPSAPNTWIAQAQALALSNSTASFNYSAAPPAGSGIGTVTGNTTVSIAPELWISGNGVTGYEMGFNFGATPNVAVTSAIDSIPLGASDTLAVDTGGNIFVDESSVIHLFSAATYLLPPIDVGSTVNTNAGASDLIGGMVVDANDYLYVPDATDPANAGGVFAYNNSVPNGTLSSVAFGATSGASVPIGSGTVTGNGAFPASLNAPGAIAIAPSVAAVPAQLQGTFWVATGTGVEVLKSNGSGFTDVGQAISLGAVPSAVAVGSDGTVWVYSPKSGTLYAYAMSATFPLSPEATFAVTSAASQMATDAIGDVWLPTTISGNYYLYRYGLSGCPSCAITATEALYTGVNDTGIYIAP